MKLRNTLLILIGFLLFASTLDAQTVTKRRPDQFPVDATPADTDAFYTQEAVNGIPTPRKIYLTALKNYYSPQVNGTAVSFVVSSSGNSSNFNQFVTDSNGDKWYIGPSPDGIAIQLNSGGGGSSQTLSLSGDTLTISGGNNVVIPSSSSQTLALSNDTLTISSGNSIVLPSGTVDQTLSISNDTLSISGSGNSVVIPSATQLWTQTSTDVSRNEGKVFVGGTNEDPSGLSLIVANRTDTLTTSNRHAFSHASSLHLTNDRAFNSFDGIPTISGDNGDHYVFGQSRPIVQMSGAIDNLWALTHTLTIDSGTVVNHTPILLKGGITNNNGSVTDQTLIDIQSQNHNITGTNDGIRIRGNTSNSATRNRGLWIQNQGSNGEALVIDDQPITQTAARIGGNTIIHTDANNTDGSTTQLEFSRSSSAVGDQQNILFKSGATSVAEIGAELITGADGAIVFKTKNSSSTPTEVIRFTDPLGSNGRLYSDNNQVLGASWVGVPSSTTSFVNSTASTAAMFTVQNDATENSAHTELRLQTADGAGETRLTMVKGSNLWAVGMDNGAQSDLEFAPSTNFSSPVMRLSTAGKLRLDNYGTGTTITGTELFNAAFDANGNLIPVSPITNTNIGNTDFTLSELRTIDGNANANGFEFDELGFFRIQNALSIFLNNESGDQINAQSGGSGVELFSGANRTTAISAGTGTGKLRLRTPDIITSGSADGQVLQLVTASGSNGGEVEYVDKATLARKTITADETLSVNDYEVWVDASGGAISLTIPNTSNGKNYKIMRIDSSANTVALVAASGNINGSVSVNITGQWNGYMLSSDGTDYVAATL